MCNCHVWLLVSQNFQYSKLCKFPFQVRNSWPPKSLPPSHPGPYRLEYFFQKKPEKWYFVTKIVLPTVRKKNSSDREKLLKFEAVGWEFAKFLRSLEHFIQIVKGQNNFWQQNAFLTCSWRFLVSSESEQLEFKLEKIIGI